MVRREPATSAAINAAWSEHEETCAASINAIAGWRLEMVRRRCQDGCGVLMISEDLDELLAVCDRIVVLHDGEVSDSVDPADTDRRRLGQMMLGAAA